MDPSSYKTTITPRGIKYAYFSSPATAGKPTLIFLHGFPSNAYGWRHQVVFFVNQGFGVLAPDLLGYGGTDKPTETAFYAKSLMSADIISIMDKEDIGTKVYAIGHDWKDSVYLFRSCTNYCSRGCALTSGLANFYPDRFVGFAYLTVGYRPPNIAFTIESFYERTAALAGRETHGYWRFVSEDGADKVIADHMDSFMSVLYPHDPEIWLTDMGPSGKLKEWTVSGKVTLSPSYITEEEINQEKAELLKGGLAGPLCWYKQFTTGAVAADDKLVPKENYIIKQPVFFGAALEDRIAIAKFALMGMKDACPNLTVREYQTDHWVQLAAPDKLNKDLLEWIKSSP
ncbi:Alpha/Beta hydrolase protein [Mycena epipterygia]|nr:Alpha/Beta hydrolase protein [Mycena epipterygia]